MIHGPMLDRISSMPGCDRVFEVKSVGDGKFDLYEVCDGCFGVTLTADELIALANELIEIANGQRQ